MHTPLYLDTARSVENYFGSIASASIIALDTEGASFHRFVDRIYLLQLSTREQTAIVDPLRVHIVGLDDRKAIVDPLPIGKPEALGVLLESPSVEVVFHDADYDLRLLQQDYGWHVRNIFDTRIAAQLLGIRAFGLAALLDRFFGVKLDKKTLTVGGETVNLILWDIAGEDNASAVRTTYLRGSAGYLLVADGTRASTLDVAQSIATRAEAEIGQVPFLLLVNKCDLRSEWVIPENRLDELTALGWTVRPTSAKTGESVEAVFQEIADRVVR